jgi:hypothetical protein
MHTPENLPSFLNSARLADCPVFYRFLSRVDLCDLAEFGHRDLVARRRLGSCESRLSEGGKPISGLTIYG